MKPHQNLYNKSNITFNSNVNIYNDEYFLNHVNGNIIKNNYMSKFN